MAATGEVVLLDGHKLKALRIAKGFYSRRALAGHAVIAPGAVDNAENGRPVMLKTAEKIAAKLGTTVVDLRDDARSELLHRKSNGDAIKLYINDDDSLTTIETLLDDIAVMHGLLRDAIEAFKYQRHNEATSRRREKQGVDQQMQPLPESVSPPEPPDHNDNYVISFHRWLYHPLQPDVKLNDTCVFYRAVGGRYQLFILITDSIPMFVEENGWESADLPGWVISLAEIDAEPSQEMIDSLERAYGEHAWCGEFTGHTPGKIERGFGIERWFQ